MRVLCLTRGLPGAGKSTFLQQKGLSDYTISPDRLRLLLSAPVLNLQGELHISQTPGRKVWELVLKLLSERMKLGAFSIVDAIHLKVSQLLRYQKLCDQYCYRLVILDFTQVPLQTCLRRNQNRGICKVPAAVIESMAKQLQEERLPDHLTVIKAEDFDTKVLYQVQKPRHLNVYVIGDVHGCYSVLSDFLSFAGGIENQDNLYVFVGDYLDRGAEIRPCLDFFLKAMHRDNVILLEGNHERYLLQYARGEHYIRSAQFKFVTVPELEKSGVDKAQLSAFYHHLVPCYYFKKIVQGEEFRFLVNHGGVSSLSVNPVFIDTSAFVQGVGRYEDYLKLASSWAKLSDPHFVQIFGHRRTEESQPKLNARVYNLEGRVEFGGTLRVVKISAQGIETLEFKNRVFRENCVEIPPLTQGIAEDGKKEA